MLPGGIFNSKYELELAIVRTRAQWGLLALAVAFLLAFPFIVDDYWVTWLSRTGIVVVIVLGLHILMGLCGQVSIGQTAFVSVGAYTTAVLAGKGVNGWLCLPIALILTGLIGLIAGLPSFRLRHFYLSVATMAAASIITYVITHMSLTGGFLGLSVDSLRLGPIDFGNRRVFYGLAMVVMVAATVFAKNIQRTRAGRAFMAIRDNELAAQANGINVDGYKRTAFFISCAYAGVAGWLWAYANLSVNPADFTFTDSIWYIGMIAVGGTGSIVGVFFGVGFFRILQMVIDEVTPSLVKLFPDLVMEISTSLALILYGAVIVYFVAYQSGGLVSLWNRFKTFYRRYPYSTDDVSIRKPAPAAAQSGPHVAGERGA